MTTNDEVGKVMEFKYVPPGTWFRTDKHIFVKLQTHLEGFEMSHQAHSVPFPEVGTVQYNAVDSTGGFGTFPDDYIVTIIANPFP